jgi:hypothetical protein
MTIYHYAVIERPRSHATSAADLNPNMESVDYKRQPSPKRLREAIEASAGVTCGIFRGGMFGLTTNQIAVLSAWEDFDTVHGEALPARGSDRRCIQKSASYGPSADG